MEENGRRGDWKSGRDLERSWRLGPKQDQLEMLGGRPTLLKERKEISQVKARMNVRPITHPSTREVTEARIATLGFVATVYNWNKK
jgi:hypothetical protein